MNIFDNKILNFIILPSTTFRSSELSSSNIFFTFFQRYSILEWTRDKKNDISLLHPLHLHNTRRQRVSFHSLVSSTTDLSSVPTASGRNEFLRWSPFRVHPPIRIRVCCHAASQPVHSVLYPLPSFSLSFFPSFFPPREHGATVATVVHGSKTTSRALFACWPEGNCELVANALITGERQTCRLLAASFSPSGMFLNNISIEIIL